jgi:RNA polymerase sigma factor for flagellar operon FliA
VVDREGGIEALWTRYRSSASRPDRDQLIVHYSPLVKYVAGRVAVGLPQNVEHADLVSYGMFGLIDAIDKFDPERGFKFETYAISRIKGAILDELRSIDWVPRSVRAKVRAIEKGFAKLEARLHRAPTDEELAEALGMDMDEFRTALIQISNASIVALDEMWSMSPGGEPVSLMDTLGDARAGDPADLLESTDLRDTLADAIARLPERERIVVALYYYDNLSLKEIGEILGVTESRVSQLHTKAVLRLKGRLQEEAEEAASA